MIKENAYATKPNEKLPLVTTGGLQGREQDCWQFYECIVNSNKIIF